MIQRIQSIYLLLTTILSGLFLKGNILTFDNNRGDVIIMKFRGIFQIIADQGSVLTGNTIPFSVIAVMVPVISLLSVLLFKNRKLQIRATLILIILEILVVAISVYYVIELAQNHNVSIVPGFKMFIPLLTIAFSFLAYRGIKKDDALVKSYERLR